jgi:hypothetical protein
MPKTLPIAFLVAPLVWGCAAVSPVTPGMDEMQVQARMGKPETVRKNSDGSQVWEYPMGPSGRQTYMVAVGADHSVKDVQQVLTDAYFDRVKPGMSRDDVRTVLGKPGIVSNFPARDEEVWSWRYLQINPMFFDVLFDRRSGTVRTTQKYEEILWMDQDC